MGMGDGVVLELAVQGLGRGVWVDPSTDVHDPSSIGGCHKRNQTGGMYAALCAW